MTLTGDTASVQAATVDAIAAEADMERARKVWEMRQAKMPWFQIAEALACTEREAKVSLDVAIREAADDYVRYSRSQLLAQELGVIDALHAAHWKRATEGYERVVVTKDGDVIPVEEPPDIKAAEMILKLSDKRTKLLGLDVPDKTDGVIQTVVIRGDSAEDFIASVRQAIPGPPAGMLQEGEQ